LVFEIETKTVENCEKTMNICKFAIGQTLLSGRSTRFSSISNLSTFRLGSSLTPKFLMPQTQSIQPQAGLKHVEKPHRRCCHCYMVFEDERTWVFCDKYPRHKQVTRQLKRDERNKGIMTHATNGGNHRNKNNPRGSMSMWTQARFRLDF